MTGTGGAQVATKRHKPDYSNPLVIHRLTRPKFSNDRQAGLAADWRYSPSSDDGTNVSSLAQAVRWVGTDRFKELKRL